MNETESNPKQKKSLRWFFEQDPRSQSVENPRDLSVITIRIADFPRISYSRDATLREGGRFYDEYDVSNTKLAVIGGVLYAIINLKTQPFKLVHAR